MENLALHPQQPGFDRGRPAKSPEQRREAMNELLLNRRLRQIRRDDRVVECPVFLGVFESFNDGLGREPLPQRVLFQQWYDRRASKLRPFAATTFDKMIYSPSRS
jgi:hypothetical protein